MLCAFKNSFGAEVCHIFLMHHFNCVKDCCSWVVTGGLYMLCGSGICLGDADSRDALIALLPCRRVVQKKLQVVYISRNHKDWWAGNVLDALTPWSNLLIFTQWLKMNWLHGINFLCSQELSVSQACATCNLLCKLGKRRRVTFGTSHASSKSSDSDIAWSCNWIKLNGQTVLHKLHK